MKWITISYSGLSPSGKTARWTVRSADGNIPLGEVRWYAAWRKYVFYPEPGTLFEEDCLRDIAEFVQTSTVSHRASRQGRT